MLTVLYTNDLEPITVLDVPQGAWDRLLRGQRLRIPVMGPISICKIGPVEPTKSSFRCVELWTERFRRNGADHNFLFTNDDESALLLRSEFLAGQRRELQSREDKAFLDGFIGALARL